MTAPTPFTSAGRGVPYPAESGALAFAIDGGAPRVAAPPAVPGPAPTPPEAPPPPPAAPELPPPEIDDPQPPDSPVPVREPPAMPPPMAVRCAGAPSLRRCLH